MSGKRHSAIAVTLLAKDSKARRLILAWPTIERGLTGRDRSDAWAQAAGVPISVAARTGALLIHYGLALEDGATDPEADKVVHAAAASTLRSMSSGKKS